MKPDAEILWGVVANARRAWETKSVMRRPLWSCVVEATGLGSTSATELCERFGFDPDSTDRGTDAPPLYPARFIEIVRAERRDPAMLVMTPRGDVGASAWDPMKACV